MMHLSFEVVAVAIEESIYIWQKKCMERVKYFITITKSMSMIKEPMLYEYSIHQIWTSENF